MNCVYFWIHRSSEGRRVHVWHGGGPGQDHGAAAEQSQPPPKDPDNQEGDIPQRGKRATRVSERDLFLGRKNPAERR